MKIKHIYWFAYYNLDEASVRYRALYPLQHLQDQQQISYNIVYPGYDFKNLGNFLLTFLSALFFRKKDSLIVFQKIYSRGIYATALKILLYFRPHTTQYDTDDAEHVRRPDQTMLHFMKRCTACSVGSHSLIDYVSQFNPNVFLLTSPIIDHGIIKTEREKIFTVGWIGYYGAHRESLTTLFFPALLKVDFPLILRIVGAKNETEAEEIRAYFSKNKNIIVEAPYNLNWYDEFSIYEIIKTFDIGVAPLTDNEFNRAKSAFKLKQCLSCGVPVLASSVGENKHFLRDGINGFLCDGPTEYFEKILLIRENFNTLYQELSNNAKSTFPLFSVDYYCGLFLEYWKKQAT